MYHFSTYFSKGRFEDFGAILSCRVSAILWGQMHGYEQEFSVSERIRSMPGQVSMKMSSVVSDFRVNAVTVLQVRIRYI